MFFFTAPDPPTEEIPPPWVAQWEGGALNPGFPSFIQEKLEAPRCRLHGLIVEVRNCFPAALPDF